jgi:HPt (histidine-containing phosphotransfer) domain-containing protein
LASIAGSEPQAKDAQFVERIAHTLKESRGNMDASRIATEDLSRALGLLDQLEMELECVRAALAAILPYHRGVRAQG